MPGQLYPLEPHLPRGLHLVDMDVQRFVRLVAVEVEAIAVNAKDGGRALNLAMAEALTKSGYGYCGLGFCRRQALAWHR